MKTKTKTNFFDCAGKWGVCFDSQHASAGETTQINPATLSEHAPTSYNARAGNAKAISELNIEMT